MDENIFKMKDIVIEFDSRKIVDPYSDSECKAFLEKRGVAISEVRALNCGFSPKIWVNGTKYFKRLLIPVVENGRLISIEGRRVNRDDPTDTSPKVLYPFHSSSNTLLDYDNLDRSQPLYVVEGAMDLMVLRSCPLFKNSTSMFGASITKRQIHLLEEFPEVILINDLDDAGKKSVEALAKSSIRNAYNLQLPKSIHGIEIKDIGDIPKTGTTVSDLAYNTRWLKYTRRL